METAPIISMEEDAPIVTEEFEGGTITGHPDSLARYKRDKVKAKAQSVLKEQRWGEGGHDGMARLCQAFPSLAGAAGTSPWCADRFLTYALSGLSSGANHAARFCLQVYNLRTDWPRYLAKVAKQDAPSKVRQYVDGDEATLARARAAAKRAGHSVSERTHEGARELVIEFPHEGEAILWKHLQRYLVNIRKDLAEEAKRDRYRYSEETLHTKTWEHAEKGFARLGTFNAVEAVSVWDAAHLAAFLSWVEAPFWP